MGSQPSLSILFLLLSALLCFQSVAYGSEPSTRLYVAYLGEKKHENPDLVTNSHIDILSSVLGSTGEALDAIVYSYKHSFSGFAARLTESQAEILAELPDVISVEPSHSFPLHTTHSWDSLGLHYYNQHHEPTGLLERSRLGEDIIIGVVDSGIWPESRSFDGSGYGPAPSRWKGECHPVSFCNRKIIGARYYSRHISPTPVDREDYLSPNRTKDINPKFVDQEDYRSPRDTGGHGTHTASTAAGALVPHASFHGLAAGRARGGAPRARLAIYKVCYNKHCEEAAIIKALDDAVHDGVDVLSISIGSSVDYPDTRYPALLHAVAKGIIVVFSGGNNGPTPKTVTNNAPWVITVAATTIDRAFPVVIELETKPVLRVLGQSKYFYGDDVHGQLYVAAEGCSVKIPNAAGKIVLCYDPLHAKDNPPRVDFPRAVRNVRAAGGSGVIFAEYSGSILHFIDSACQSHGIPCVIVDYEIAHKLVLHCHRTARSCPTVKVKPPNTKLEGEPKVVAFSSRGPSLLYPELIKPDVAAPGFMILAAKNSGTASFQFMSGTSMACPHVAGVVALLKKVHPDWSPAAIKSALVTTASVRDKFGIPMKAEGVPRKVADAFDYGGGLINPEKAADPGLIYDIHSADYYRFFRCTPKRKCAFDQLQEPLYNLNLPSISIPSLRNPVTVRRTVTNVGNTRAAYRAVIQSPPGINMTVEPSVLKFDSRNKKQSFALTFARAHKVQGDYQFGSLTWSDGHGHSVKIPIVVRGLIYKFFADSYTGNDTLTNSMLSINGVPHESKFEFTPI